MKTQTSLRAFLALTGSVMLMSSQAFAVTYYWDGNDGTAGFGTATGTWTAVTAGTTTSGWSTDATGATVVDANSVTTALADVINFGNGATGLAAGTITVSGTVDAGNMTFASGSGAIVLSGGTINLAAAQTTTVNNATNTISSILSGAGTSFTKAGSGILVLSGANSYTGTTIVNRGTLTLNSATGSLADASALTFTGTGTFNMDNVGASGNLSETLGALTFSAGQGTVQTTRTADFDQAITFASLSARTAGATGNFVNTGTNSATNGFIFTAAPTAGTLIDRGIFYNGSSYATYDAGGFVRGFTAGDTNYLAAPAADTIGSSTATSNVEVTGAIALQTTVSANTLNLGANNLTFSNAANILSVNGILSSGAPGATINNTTTASKIQATALGNEIVIRVNGASDQLTINQAIRNFGVDSGGTASALTKSGDGKLILTAASTYTGVTAINAGTLQLGTNGTTGALSTSSSIVIAAGGNLTINRSDNVAQGTIFSSTISGAGTVTKSGGGALTLTNNASNSYSGGFIFNSGSIVTPTGTFLGFGTGTLTINGGLFNNPNSGADFTIANNQIWNGNWNTTNVSAAGYIMRSTGAITLTNNITIGSKHAMVIDGAIGQDGTVRNLILQNNAGTGAYTFNGVNTYTGSTTLNSTSTLTIGGSGSLGAGNYAGAITFNAAQTFTYASSANQILSGVISGATGILTKDTGTLSTLTLSGAGANTYAGLTTVTAGTLELAKSGTATAFGGNLVLGGANNTIARVTYTGVSTNMIANAATVAINGRSRFDFNGATDTISNVTIVNTGSSTDANSIINTAGGGNLTIGTLAITPAAGLTTVVNAGTGTITLGGNVTFTAATTGRAQITGTTLALGAATRTFTVGLGSGASEDLLIDAAISGSSVGLTKAGAGRLTLSGSSGYTGVTTVNAGTLNVTGSLTGGGATTLSGGTLDLGGGTASGSLSSTVLNLGGGTLSYTRTGNTTQNFTTTNLNAGPLSAVSAVSGNTLNLGTIVNAGGAIVFGSTGAGTVAADTASNVGGIISGATFNGTDWAVANGTTSAITAYGAGAYTLTSAAGNTAANYTGFNMSVDSSQSPAAVITTNSLRFNNEGAFTLTLTGTTNTISSGGIMVDSTVGNNASVITGGTLRGGVSGGLHIIQNNTTGASSALTISSIIANNTSTALNKSGAGTLILTNSANSYTGATAINGGTLEIGGAGRLGSGTYAGAITIASGATFMMNSSANQTITGLISGAGGLTKSGTGILILGNSLNSYTGKTLVTGGVIQSGIAWNNQPDSIPGGMGNASTGSNIELNGGILSMTFNFDRSLGSGPGQIQITGGRSGISTMTSPRGLWTVGGNASFEVVWGASGEGAATGFFNPSTFVMNDAAASPTYQSTLANPVDLNGANRTIEAASSSFFGQISGVIRNSNTSTAAGLVKTGVGELRLASANTFNGTTTISGGILNLTNGSALQNSALDTTNSVTGGASAGLRTTATTLTLGGLIGNKDFDDTAGSVFTTTSGGYNLVTALTLNVGTGNSYSYSGAIGNGAATTSLTKSGLGSQTLSGSNTYTGATTISAGTLALGNGGNLLGSATVGTAVSVTGTLAVSQTANATSNAIGQVGQSTASTLTFNAGSALNMSDTYTSTLNLVGTATLAPATGTSPTFTFDLNGASNGTTDLLAISGAATVGAANVNIIPVFSSPGSLSSSNTYTVMTAASGLGTANFTLGGQFNYAIGGSIWSTSLATSTASSQIVSFVNTAYAPTTAYWQGGTDGSWKSQNGTSFVTNFTQDAEGAYNWLATPVSTSSVFVGTNAASNLSAMTLDQAFSIVGLTYNGTGTSNTAGSTLAAGTGGSLTIGTGGITVLSGSGANTISAPVTLGGVQSWTNNSANLLTVSGAVTNDANNLTVTGTGNTTISGNLGSGSGTLTKSGAGTLELSGANAYSGTTTVSLGTLILSGSNSSAGATTVSGGILQLNSNSNGGLASGTFTVGGGTVQALNADRTISQGITLSGNPTFSGNYSITSPGQMNGGAAARIITNNITAGKTLSLAGYTSSTGNLNFQGTGTTIMNNAITLGSGQLIFDTGTVMLNAGGNTSSLMTIQAGGTVIARSGANLGSTLTMVTGSSFSYVAASDVNMGSGAAGSITFNNNNTLGVSVGNTTSSASIFTTNNVVFATGAGSRNVTVNIYGVPGVSRSGNGNYQLIRGATAGTNLTNGIYTLGTVFNNTDFTVGAITTGAAISGGAGSAVFAAVTTSTPITAAFWKGGLSGNTTVWAASTGITGGTSNWATTSGGSEQVLIPGAGADVTIDGSFATAPTSTRLGADVNIKTLTLTNSGGLGINADGFKLTITPGAATDGINISTGVAASTIAANVGLGAAQTWTNNSVNALTVSGVISGSSALTTAGTGTVTLTGINTYSGATTVSAGTLIVDGSISTSTLTTVDLGATLGGGGTVGALTFDGGAFFDLFQAIGNLNALDSSTISFATTGFGIDNLVSNGGAITWAGIANGTYTLINGTLDNTNLANFGVGNAYDIGGGRGAYFQNGSLQLVVATIPEPTTALLGCLGLLLVLRRRR